MNVEQVISYSVQAVGLLISLFALVSPYLGSLRLERDISIFNGYIELARRSEERDLVSDSDLELLRSEIDRRMLYRVFDAGHPKFRRTINTCCLVMIAIVVVELLCLRDAIDEYSIPLAVFIGFVVIQVILMKLYQRVRRNEMIAEWLKARSSQHSA